MLCASKLPSIPSVICAAHIWIERYCWEKISFCFAPVRGGIKHMFLWLDVMTSTTQKPSSCILYWAMKNQLKLQFMEHRGTYMLLQNIFLPYILPCIRNCGAIHPYSQTFVKKLSHLTVDSHKYLNHLSPPSGKMYRIQHNTFLLLKLQIYKVFE